MSENAVKRCSRILWGYVECIFEVVCVKVELRERRMEKHLTQRQLAELTEIGQNHLSRIEQGKVMPKVDMANRIARTLGVTTFEIWKDLE